MRPHIRLQPHHIWLQVPSQLGSLASLVQLGLGGSNRLSGTLPAALCAPLGRIVGGAPPGAKLSCDLGGDARWSCPLPCAAVAARCGARCDAAPGGAAVAAAASWEDEA